MGIEPIENKGFQEDERRFATRLQVKAKPTPVNPVPAFDECGIVLYLFLSRQGARTCRQLSGRSQNALEDLNRPVGE
jgi:hypothetical protein